MSKLVKMAKELLIIDEDLAGRLDYIRWREESKQLRGDVKNYYELYTFERRLDADEKKSAKYKYVQSDEGERRVDETRTYPLVTQRTYVFVPKQELPDEMCFVFFGSRFAYAVPYSEEFMNDVKAHNVADIEDATQRYLADANWYNKEE